MFSRGWCCVAKRGVLAFGLAVLSACGPGPPPPSAPHKLLNKPLPNFSRRTVDGGRVDTKAGRGKTVVVKFFAKYCEPCKKTLPAAEALHREHPEVLLIGVALDEYRADVNAVIAAHQLTFPVVHDRGNILSGRFRVAELPATFVAGPAGVIQWYAGAAQTENGLRRVIAAQAARGK
jgi:thiol-disulfide isomerase/thioredoxin